MKKSKIYIVVAIVVVLLGLVVFPKNGTAGEKSKVIIIRDSRVLNDESVVNKEALKKMLDRALTEFYGVNDPVDAWKKAFKRTDKVAIKVNTLAAWYAIWSSPFKAVTHPELAYAIADGIISAGVKPGNIVIYDRNTSARKGESREELSKSGYKLSNDPNNVRVQNGGEYGPVHKLSNGLEVNFLKYLEEADKIVNAPILKAHHIMGYSFALKNHLGSYKDAATEASASGTSIPAGAAGSMHGDAGIPGVAALNSDPVIKNKTALIIGDMLRVQCRSLFSDPEGSWPYDGIIIGDDPVAVDAVALDILTKKRKEMGINYFIGTSLDQWYMASPKDREKFKSYPQKMKYGGVADKYLYDCGNKGLGNSDLKNIDLKIIELE